MLMKKRKQSHSMGSISKRLSSMKTSSQSARIDQLKPHPCGVKPHGNYFFESKTTPDSRPQGLGSLYFLQDEMILDICRYLDYTELCRLCQTSKVLYCFARLDELWKEITLNKFDGNFFFVSDWKTTFAVAFMRRINPNIQADLRGPQKPIQVSGLYSDALFNRWYLSSVDGSIWAKEDNIDRRSNLSLEDFILEYAIPNKPVVLTDIVEKWNAAKEWTKEKLIADFGETTFKTDQGVAMKLKDYFQYSDQVKEHQPMYLFDNDFAEKEPRLLQDYEVPIYFREDFFSVLGHVHRPSFRWLLIGPPKSGSTFHKDPNATSAWNGLISGAKKWILYPPDIAPPGVYPSEDGFDVTTPESITEWFVDFYKLTKSGSYRPVECVQKPGELIFIPSTWWHCALNLVESIAVTQNVVSTQNLSTVLNFLKSKKKQELYDEFYSKMKEKFPESVNKIENAERSAAPKKMTMWEKLTGGDGKNENETEETSSFQFGF